MERPFERKSSDDEARISRQRKEASPGRDLFVEAYQDLGGVPNPIGIPPRERRSPPQSGEFKRAKNIRPTDEIEEIPAEDVEEVPNEAAAEAALEMSDGDTVPTREVMPWASTLPNEKSRQQKRAEARQVEKRTSRSEKTSKSIFDANDDEETSRTSVKKARGFYPPGSLPEVIARMDKVEEDLARLNRQLKNGHEEIVSGTEKMRESLMKELDVLRKSLTTARKESSPLPATVEAAQPPAQDQPEMSWSEEEIDNPDFVAERSKPSRSKKKGEQKPALEGQALLESLANKYGIILSAEARAARLQELDRMIDPVKVAEEARLKELLTDDEETLRTTEDITPSNKKSLSGRIRETRARLAELSEELSNARDEKDTLLEYPTAAEEVEFNMAETIEEIARTKPSNAIRLRQLHNTFADLEQMKNLLRSEAENLAERYGILIDPTQREAQLTRLQKNVRRLQEEFNQVDDAILSRQERQKETNIFKVRDRLGEEIKKLEEKREQIRNLYNEAGDRYSAALVSSPEKEIEARIQELREDRDNGSHDTQVTDERIAELERLKKLLPPPRLENEIQPQDLGLDYTYEKTEKKEPASTEEDLEVDLDEENTVNVVEPEEAIFQWTPSTNKMLREEEAKYRAPREERDLPPRALPGQTRESLVQRIGKMDEMLRTGTVDGKVMSSQRRQQLARGRDALVRSLDTKYDTSTTEANDNGRISGSRETLLPFPTSGSSDPDILEEDRLIAEHEVAKTEQAQIRERNIQVYKARAQQYKKELKEIADALAERGEFVEVPGQNLLATEPEKRSWFSSVWNRIKEATVRRDVATLKKQYETALERYEEATQLKNAVERNTPVYERANITQNLKVYAEKPGQVEQRRAEQAIFEDKLKHLAETERAAQDLMDSLILNQRKDGSILEKKEKREEVGKIGNAILKQRTDDQEYNKLTRARRNNIPVIQLEKLAAGEEFNQYFEFDEATLEGIQAIQKSTERTLKALEAKASIAKTKAEREESRKRLNELKKLLGGKDAEEMAERAAFLVRAAERVGLMEIEDPSLHQDLASRYGARINELKTWLEPKGKEAELLIDLEKELKHVVQETNTRF